MVNYITSSEDLLTELGLKHGTDKANPHFFTSFYDKFFNSNRETVLNLLEIGVAKKSSLRMWKDYFFNANIYGIDIDTTTMFEEDRIKTFNISQIDIGKIKETFTDKKFDVIIDDGSHMTSHQIFTFLNIKDLIKNGGYYIIEDLQTSFMPGYVDTEETAVQFLENLSHDNHNIEFLEFFHNMDQKVNVDCITCVIKFK